MATERALAVVRFIAVLELLRDAEPKPPRQVLFMLGRIPPETLAGGLELALRALAEGKGGDPRALLLQRPSSSLEG